MKPKLIAILRIGCLLGSTTLHAQTPPNLTNNLIAFYTFEGNANDTSGTGNSATPAGNYQFVSNGISGSAFRTIGDLSQFYAGGGHLMLPAFTSGLNSGFTYSLWVKNEAAGVEPVGAESYIAFQNGTADSAFKTGITLANWSPAFVGFGMGNGSGSGVDYKQTITMPAYTNGWKHLVVSYSPGSFACYFNGVKLGQTNVTFNAFPAPYAALNRHWWPTGSSARMSVTYDNVRVFNRALSDSEIQQLYAYEGVQLAIGLLAYYPFNGNANDESGNGNNASVVGAVLTEDRFGVTNKAVHFNGAGDRIGASIAAMPLGNSPRSITAWIKPDSDAHPVNEVAGYGNGDCTDLMFSISFSKYNGGTPNYNNVGFWGGCRDYFANLFTPSNQWTFVALTFDGSSIRLYANGMSEANAIGALNTQSSQFWIGAETLNDGASFRDFFKGSIDDVRFYNRALSLPEVAQIFAIESGPRVDLIKAVRPSFSNLTLGTNYQLQLSGNLNEWTNQGSTFTATNTSMVYPQYWDVENWDSLFFRLQQQ